eukprot:3245057-Prymnesium_polylepis.1
MADAWHGDNTRVIQRYGTHTGSHRSKNSAQLIHEQAEELAARGDAPLRADVELLDDEHQQLGVHVGEERGFRGHAKVFSVFTV